MAELSTTGKWVDRETGQVVDSPPPKGRLLVAPGGELTPDVKAKIERAEAVAPPAPAPPETAGEDAGDAEKADDDADVETASEDGAPETAAKTGRTGTARKR